MIEQLVDINPLLTEEERLLRDQVRRFVRERWMPVVVPHYRAGTFPHELRKPLAEMGLLGANLTGYECAGVSAVAYGLIMEELEWGDSGLRSYVSVQGSLAMFPIWRFGSEEQKQRWLPKMAGGELLGCFGLTEPDSGSDPGSMKTRAVADGKHYVLNGSKMWITNSPEADVAVVWAKLADGPGDPGAEAIRGFVIERGTKGFETPTMHGKLSLRASSTGEIVLSDCRVPKENLLSEGAGLKAPLSCLNHARFGIAWGALGAARSCYETALAYTKERKQFGRAIASYQLTQQKLVEMASEIAKGELVMLHLGRLKDQGKITPVQVSFAKRNNVRAALEIARVARSMLGANGIIDEYPVMRHMCNLESVFTYEGTHEIHTLAIGRALTGFSSFE